LSDCDYTQKKWEIINHIQAHVQAENNLINKLFRNHFKMLNQGEVDPSIANKVIVPNMFGNDIEFINVYVQKEQWNVIKICNLYWLQIFTLCQTMYQQEEIIYLTTRLMLF
jgi:hypothetical protein